MVRKQVEMAQVPNKSTLQKMLFKMVMLLITANIAAAGKHEDFEFMDQVVTFKQKTEDGYCSAEIFYPELLSKSDPEIADKMNVVIDQVIKSYQMCNSRSKNYQFHTTYEIIKSSDKIMSLKFITKHNDKIVHIAALNLNVENGEAVAIEQIFGPLDNSFMLAMIELSNNHLAKNISLQEFREKINHKDIQYYLSEATWHLVFNAPVDWGKEPYIAKIPKSLLKIKL